MADKSPLAYLPEMSEEAIQANREHQEALKRLNEALDQRKNRFFDPRYLAAAQAFLTPTKTGSFFESLGTAAGAVGKAQEGLLQEEQEIAKLQAELTGQNLGLIRQKMLTDQYMRGRQPTPAKGAPAAGGTVPSGDASTAEPAGAMSRDDFIMQRVIAGKSPADAELEYAKYLEDVINVTSEGTYDRLTGKFRPHRLKSDRVVITVPGVNGAPEDREVDAELASQINAARNAGNRDEYNRLVAIARNPLAAFQQGALPAAAAPEAGGALPAPAATPQAPAVPTAPPSAAPSTGALEAVTQPPALPPSTPLPAAPTVAEKKARERQQEIEQAAALEEAKGVAKGATESYDMARKASEQSGTLFTAAENIINLVKEQPDAFRTALNRPGIAGAIMRAANEGISTGVAGKISLPAGELSRAGLNEQQLTALQMYANQIALAKNANRQMTRVPGEGAVSDFETKLMNAMLEVDYATPQAIQFINELTMMRARQAELRFETMNRLREQGIPLSKILTHPEMQDLKAGYESALRGLAQRNAQLLKPSRAKETESVVGKTKTKLPKGKLSPDELENKLDKMLGGG